MTLYNISERYENILEVQNELTQGELSAILIDIEDEFNAKAENIVTDYGYMAFPSELDDLIDFQLDEYKKDELIDVLEAFSGDGIKIYLKAKIMDYINIFKKQGRDKEIMEILQFEEGRAWE